MKKFLIPFMIGAAVALAVEFFQKENHMPAVTQPAAETPSVVPSASADAEK